MTNSPHNPGESLLGNRITRMMKSPTHLTVPFAQKDKVKAPGARRDPARKHWYVPERLDTAGVTSQNPRLFLGRAIHGYTA